MRRRPKRAYKKHGARSVQQVGRQITTRRNFCKLTYEVGNIGSTTTTALGNFQINLNSVYDPQYASGGGQPRGFDQWAGFYANYRVHGAKVVVYAQSLTPGYQSILAMTHRTIATAPSNVKELMEQPAVSKCVFTSDKPCVKSRYYDIAKCLALSKKQYNNDDLYWAGTGANPAQLLLLNISWCNINESTSTGHNIRATVTYYVEFFKPLVLGAS